MKPIMRLLTREHGVIQGVLDLLDRELALAADRQPFDRGLVVLALRYLRDSPEWFHHPREEALFTRAITRSPQFEERFADVWREHDDMPRTCQKLLDDLDAIGGDAILPEDAILAELRDYSALQRRHMQRENEDIFPLLIAVLQDDDWDLPGVDGTGSMLGSGDPGPFRLLFERLEAEKADIERTVVPI